MAALPVRQTGKGGRRFSFSSGETGPACVIPRLIHSLFTIIFLFSYYFPNFLFPAGKTTFFFIYFA